jgi:hypothetical protein
MSTLKIDGRLLMSTTVIATNCGNNLMAVSLSICIKNDVRKRQFRWDDAGTVSGSVGSTISNLIEVGVRALGFGNFKLFVITVSA